MDISNAQRARVLVHALPYIQDYSGKIVVVKYGGNAMVSEHLKDSVIRDICLLQLIGVKAKVANNGNVCHVVAVEESGGSRAHIRTRNLEAHESERAQGDKANDGAEAPL